MRAEELIPKDCVNISSNFDQWNQLLDDAYFAPAWYSECHILSSMLIFNDRKLEAQNLSWILEEDGRPICLLPACLRIDENGKPIIDSFGFPLGEAITRKEITRNQEKKVKSSYFEFINSLKRALDVPSPQIMLSSQRGRLTSLGEAIQRESENKGVIFSIERDISCNSNTSFGHFRKSYRSLISRGLQKYTVDTSSNPNLAIETMIRLHEEASGHKTRPDSTWKPFINAIEQNRAIVSLVTQGGNTLGAALAIKTRTNAIYWSGAYNRQLMQEKEPIGHLAQWGIINHLREGLTSGTLVYTLGNHSGSKAASKKQANIELFKAGFSSHTTAYPLVSIS